MSFFNFVQQQDLETTTKFGLIIIRVHGAILHRSLTFNAHMMKLTASLTSSLHVFRATSHISWMHLKITFHALIRSKLNYAASAWQPWLSATNISSLDCLQNRDLKLLTGQLIYTLGNLAPRSRRSAL